MNQLVIIGALTVGAFLGGAMVGSKWEEGANARRMQAEATARQEALTAAAKEIAKIDVKRVTIRAPLEKEIHEKVVYRECQHTPDGLRQLNQALAGEGAADTGKLPGHTGRAARQ